MEAEISSNVVFEFLTDSTKRITSLRGGTRSGKTTNTLIYWVTRLLQEHGKVLTIARQTMPALRASAMRDFFEILNRLTLYDESCHNKTSNEYHLHGNLVEFVGLSESMRVRGRKRNYLFLNEANESELEAFRQLAFRTTDKIVLDYNPSEAFSWIYDDVETREDCDMLVTTYLDNPFLEASLVAEIERLREADADYWKVYGLGEPGSGSSRVFTHWRETTTIPEVGIKVYGLDFGYNNPTALLEATYADRVLYWREMLYESKLTTSDLIGKLKTLPELYDAEKGRARGAEIIADSAEPKTIEEIARAGFQIRAAYKDVKDTIDFIKSCPLRVDANSPNLLREIKRYSWKTDRNGKVLDEVIKFDDHLMDGGRYGSYAIHLGETGGAISVGSTAGGTVGTQQSAAASILGRLVGAAA
jgi:phage terminase large subunit